jgi:hypothetical protein
VSALFCGGHHHHQPALPRGPFELAVVVVVAPIGLWSFSPPPAKSGGIFMKYRRSGFAAGAGFAWSVVAATATAV